MTEGSAGPTPPGGDGAQLGIEELTEDILPALIARLRASRLGEIEVRTADWRVRLRRDVRAMHRTTRADGHDGVGPASVVDPATGTARSPAVGYFRPLARLAVGQLVHAGDPLGSVDMLGIAQDVLAPGGGIVQAVLAEPGQAVEYGQPLVEIDAVALEPVEAEVPQADATAPEPVGPGGDRAVAGT